ncbi:hypothetical protein RJ639_013329 [Escallonia herrerae]|uniref:Uncharacterized protein n=1 Tax=Escallonia herrerae TaxID=1293975 RepID=A0AA88VHU3_9ASTE|nr:hypothetical protein RJ639_013329 [Escallonia herrerae]
MFGNLLSTEGVNEENMKTYLVWIIGLGCVLLSNGNEIAEAQKWQGTRPAQRSDRTAYHFQSPKNWLNGPMYYKGVYHLFYQYNPNGAVFESGNSIIWAHSVSYDLVNWIHLRHALYPTKQFDINSCWSGSATILPGNKPVIVYTGVDAKRQQVQNLAMPKNLSDPFLEEWEKYSHNPILSPTNGIKPDSFRDPSTAWLGQDGKWRIIVGSEKNGQGMALLYHSNDFLHWTLGRNPLYSEAKKGIWECPDFYPVYINSRNGVETISSRSLKYVLKASIGTQDYYKLGTYASDAERFIPDKIFRKTNFNLRYDYGKFYASKTFFDHSTSRRILCGWINESDSSADDIKKGWSGIHAVPRRVFLGKTRKQLVQWPVEEIERLREKHVGYHDKTLKGHSSIKIAGITTSQADVEVTFKLPKLEEAEAMNPNWVDPQLLCSKKNAAINSRVGPFGLLVLAAKDLSEQTAIFFRIFRGHNNYVVLMCSDQSRSSMRKGVDKTTYGAFVDIDPRHELISLRSLVDHSVIESFGGEGRACITARVYPVFSIDKEAHLHAFNNGSLDVVISRLDAWSMKKAKLTKMKSWSGSQVVGYSGTSNLVRILFVIKMSDLQVVGGIKKLNHQNYNSWATCMTSYMQGQDLWEVINGSEVMQPEAEDANGTLRKWKIKAGKAMFALKTTIEEDVLEHIRDAQTPKEAWGTLATLFSKKNDTRLQHLESELLSIA